MKSVKILMATLAVLFVLTATASAQAPAAPAPGVNEAPPVNWAKGFGAGMGAGLTILGAGLGISLIASKAVESMARQPEVAGNIQGAMIVSAALIEGVSFFSLIVCILILVLG